MQPSAAPPELSVDPFSVDVLADPTQFQHDLREAGPVARLPDYGIYATGRFDEVKAVLTDHSRFTTTGGVGLSDIRKPDAWRVKNPLLEIDPPDHGDIRSGLKRIMSPAAIRQWQETFETEAESLVDSLIDKREFDGAKDLAEAFVTSVFPNTVGITVEREMVIKFGDLNFNANGPQNELYWRAHEAVAPYLPVFERAFQRESMTPGGIGEQIYNAERDGIFPEGTALGLVRVMFRGGFDTTIAGISAALHQLALAPGQWTFLSEKPALASSAFDEALRHQSPAQVMFRTTVANEVELSGQRLEPDTKIAVFIGAANRDPRRWEDPSKFDIERPVSGRHLAFGAGAHMCIGLLIAKLEAEAVLAALARKVRTVELNGEPRHRLVNTLRTVQTLPLRITPK